MESNIRAHIIPVLGDVPIRSLDTKKFQELITSLEKRSRKTRENVYMDLQQILNAARRWHNGIPSVTKSEIYFGSKKPGEGKAFFFTLKQVTAILKAFAGRKPWELFFLMLATTGLRASLDCGVWFARAFIPLYFGPRTPGEGSSSFFRSKIKQPRKDPRHLRTRSRLRSPQHDGRNRNGAAESVRCFSVHPQCSKSIRLMWMTRRGRNPGQESFHLTGVRGLEATFR
jgi:hypothetical protein